MPKGDESVTEFWREQNQPRRYEEPSRRDDGERWGEYKPGLPEPIVYPTGPYRSTRD